MKTKEILKYLEESVAPVKLSDDFCKKFDMYDNSGIIINSGNEVTGALFALDLTKSAIERAVQSGYNLIITHHPAIYGGISKLDLTDNPLSIALAECLKHGISVISMHLNFDAAPNGIDYYLMRGLGGESAVCAANLENGAYGRIYDVAGTSLKDYIKAVGERFGTDRLRVYGAPDKQVSRVASFCGAGCDAHNIAFAVGNGADVFVSSDMKHHEILALTGRGIAVIEMTHYASENYGFNQIYNKIKDGLKVPSDYYTDGSLL